MVPSLRSGRVGRLADVLMVEARDHLYAQRARRLIERLVRSDNQVGIALVYHSVDDPPGDPATELVPSVAVEVFREQMRLLARLFQPVHASTLLEHVVSRRPGGRIPLALTFDDDVETHVRIVRNELERLGLPATFFVTGAGLAGNEASFWWDDLQAAVGSGSLEPLPHVSTELVEQVLQTVPGALHRLAAEIERLEPAERLAAAGRLRAARGTAARRLLGADELRLLGQGDFELGFHTLHHNVLLGLAEPALRRELVDGRSELARVIGHEPTTIAYPHGKADERVAAAARDAGYRLGFTGKPDAVRLSTSPWLIGRLEPGSIPPGALSLLLAARLSEQSTSG